MPARAVKIAEALRLAPWVDSLDNRCLYEMVVEALTVRASAIHHKGDPRTIAVGDQALDEIRTGRVRGDRACKKAAVALRKYDRSWGSAVE
jgi:hypothetical protein